MTILSASALILLSSMARFATPSVAPSVPAEVIQLSIFALALILLGAGLWVLHKRIGRADDSVQRLESLFDCLDEGILVCSGMQVITVNSSLCRLIGIDKTQAANLMLSAFIRDADAINRLLSTQDVRIETDIHPTSGAAILTVVAARDIDYGGQTQRLLEIRDIRQQQETQQRISFLAHNDPLTSLPNREALRARLGEVIEGARSSDQRCAVIWIDLDEFKKINDAHGHATGDDILRAVSDKLRYELPFGTMIARLGGDEFVVLCEDIGDPREARLIGQQLRRLLNRPFEIGNLTLAVGASIGVAVFPDDAATPEELLKNADLALYQAKANGRARCRLFTQDIARDRQRRILLSEQLPRAIASGDIQTYFQPLVRNSDLRVAGFETLARWFHPEFGPIPPPEFVGIAEETGLIASLTDCIMRQGIEAARQWPQDVRLAVNISPVQINAELVDRVRGIIKSSNFDPERLELEVTEDVLIKDFDQTASMFARLRALGVQVAMDDFGAGFTSLGNLRRLNFERIKIDRIFTIDLPNHRRTSAIVRSILVLARELDLHITVEGVETADQFAFLQAQGPLEIQGFLFSAPKPVSAWADPASLQFARPNPATAPQAATLIAIDAHRSRRAS